MPERLSIIKFHLIGLPNQTSYRITQLYYVSFTASIDVGRFAIRKGCGSSLSVLVLHVLCILCLYMYPKPEFLINFLGDSSSCQLAVLANYDRECAL